MKIMQKPLAIGRQQNTDEKVSAMLNKVPAVTILFWIIKILATTVGETAADYLNLTQGLGLVNTSYVMAVLLLIALVIQLRTRRYLPAVYWFVVVVISVMGTLISDNLTDNAGISLATSSIIFGAALVVTFILWFVSEKTLSVHSITTTHREIFYWTTILFTFALGTSAGDLLSESMKIGYAWSAVLFLGVITIVYLANRFLRMGDVLSFWIAYILTRPLGASTGDLLTADPKVGGFGITTTVINVIFFITIIVAVTYLTMKEKKRIATMKA
jgi:uncharacterized membrane-anchored protein